MPCTSHQDSNSDYSKLDPDNHGWIWPRWICQNPGVVSFLWDSVYLYLYNVEPHRALSKIDGFIRHCLESVNKDAESVISAVPCICSRLTVLSHCCHGTELVLTIPLTPGLK